MPRLKAVAVSALAALFAPALFALDLQNTPAPNSAVPGTLNYVEGSAQLNGQPVGHNAAGSAALAEGQTLATTNGHAEVLLTPGVFFRLGQNSAAKMVSPSLTDTAIAIQQGRAEVEVDQIFKQNDIHVVENNVPVQLIKTGLYEFNADKATVEVFDGEAAVAKNNGHWTLVKAGHQLNLSEGPNQKPVTFDKDQAEQSGLYRWSSLRSDYLAEANQQLAGEYGAGYAPGWYWDPWMYDYTFLGPYSFYSPFGWGFYPLGYGFYGGGFYGGGYYGRRVYPGHPIVRGGELHSGAVGGFRGGAFRAGGELGGFHGGGGGFGGFHGGGGGRGR